MPTPPDPSTNASTLAGVDSNANQLRDDLERQIAQASSTPAIFSQAVVVAAAQQALVTAQPTTKQAALPLVKSVVCALHAGAALAQAPENTLEALLNTPARRDAFAAAGALAGPITTDELGACP